MSMTVRQHINYWLTSASRDRKTMETLLKNGERAWALFLGHLTIEKLIKAICVARGSGVEKTHSLDKLAVKAGLPISQTKMIELAELSTFNIAARYPDYKAKLHLLCTPAYTHNWMVKIQWWYKYLRQIALTERSQYP